MEDTLKLILAEMKDMRSEFGQRFDTMDNRFDKLETEVKGLRMEVEKSFENIDNKLDHILDNFNSSNK